MLNKPDLRRSLLQQRRALSMEQWQQDSQQICLHLQNWDYFQQAQTVLTYYSIRQEPDLSALLPMKASWGFSRCVDRSLVWHRWSSASQPLQPGSYGIPEPHPDLPRLTAADVDLLLVPAVACDRLGYRLGYGGGYYDRLLSDAAWQTIPAIGIIFDFAYWSELPIDPWDYPLHGVCTEQGLFLCRSVSC